MALEIIVRRRRNAKRRPKTDSRDIVDPPEAKEKDDQPANDNDGDGAWPLIPFPDGF